MIDEQDEKGAISPPLNIEVTPEPTLNVKTIHDKIDEWFVAHFHNHPITRSGFVNHLIAAKDDLKHLISKL